jgi:Family of unknown function (DUF5989)
MARRGLLSEMWAFMRARKRWWLLPIVVVMLVVGALLIFAQGSALAPFIYTLF